MFEGASNTLLCSDLFSQLGDSPALIKNDVVKPTIAAKDLFGFSLLTPSISATIRRLAELSLRTLALIHGPTFAGGGATALRTLVDDYDRHIQAALA